MPFNTPIKLIKKPIYYLCFCLIVISCCKKEKIDSLKIPEDKAYLIPFKENKTLTYISEQNAFFQANAKQKNIEVIEEFINPDDCGYWTFERLKSSIFINTFEFNFEFVLATNSIENELTLTVKLLLKDDTNQYNEQDFQLVNCDKDNYFNNDLFTDIEINGFVFKKVLIFKSCYQSFINQIIYSPQNGIEYIDFVSGRFLKLHQ